MPAPRFFALAWRLTAYQGCVRALQQRQTTARRSTPAQISLSDWASAHPDAMQRAATELTGRR